MSIVPMSMKGDLHYFVKLLMLGDSGVGKSCLMTRFSDGNFPLDIIGTAGIDCKEKIVSAAEKNIKVQIWDTAGQERYSVLTESYYKKAFGIILVYDITDPNSFSSVDTWIKSIKEKGNAVVEIVLVGNKTDLQHRKKVPTKAGENLASSYHIPFIEASAKDGTNVEKAFATLIENILRNEKLITQCAVDKMSGVSISKKQPKGGCQSN